MFKSTYNLTVSVLEIKFKDLNMIPVIHVFCLFFSTRLMVNHKTVNLFQTCENNLTLNYLCINHILT